MQNMHMYDWHKKCVPRRLFSGSMFGVKGFPMHTIQSKMNLLEADSLKLNPINAVD
jgi:hypothetical protein